MHPSRHPLKTRMLAAALAALAAAPAWALYKSVGPDGTVTYSQTPPTAGTPVKQLTASGSSVPSDTLPFELKQIVSRYPVTLYSSANCAPCDSGRSLLQRRGVPYAERTISSAEDNQAFKRAESTDTLPVLRIGSQQLRGFSESEWTNYIDAAGYPKESRLPATYRAPAPTPMVVKDTAPASPERAPAPAPQAPTTPASPGEASPPGFRF